MTGGFDLLCDVLHDVTLAGHSLLRPAKDTIKRNRFIASLRMIFYVFSRTFDYMP